jgi:hypothetical protein
MSAGAGRRDRRTREYGRIVEILVLASGSVVVVLSIAWWVRRSQREVDEVDQPGYWPPPIHGQAGPH